jgi:hypothetical protein
MLHLYIGLCACIGMLKVTFGGRVARYQGLHRFILEELQPVQPVAASAGLYRF